METIRRLIRSCLGSQSPLYRKGASLLDFIAAIKTHNYKAWRTLGKLNEHTKDAEPRSVCLHNLKFPILIRPGTNDSHTVINNVIREEYGFLSHPYSPKWMIDAGAYIGDTSVYFLSRFPDLQIIALEPNHSNYTLAKKNLEPYRDRVVLLKSGLFAHDCTASFSGEGTGGAIRQTGMKIDCISIPSLLERFKIKHIDILKMDIEGAEEAVFRVNPEQWLGNLSMLLIEIHGERLTHIISRVLKESGFSMQKHRSIWYCRAI